MSFYHIGTERPLTVKMKGDAFTIPAHYPRLSDYAELTTGSLARDCEAEQCAWPERLDQRTLGNHCRVHDFEDAEDDDPAGGDVCDEPHDARDEDGI